MEILKLLPDVFRNRKLIAIITLAESKITWRKSNDIVREVWPRSFERINLVEPSQSMQRAGQSLIKNLKNLPLIHSYDSIQSLTKNINKSERDHDLVIASYVLGEIPSQQDRITIVRQLWDLTQDVLVLVEPGTPHGFNIISQMRSYILWMEKRKRRKSKAAIDDTSKDLMTLKSGAFVVAPCAHDGRCPLDNTGKYCHFVQRLQRTASQRVYKSKKSMKLGMIALTRKLQRLRRIPMKISVLSDTKTKKKKKSNCVLIGERRGVSDLSVDSGESHVLCSFSFPLTTIQISCSLLYAMTNSKLPQCSQMIWEYDAPIKSGSLD